MSASRTLLGSTVGPYDLFGILGEGGFGAVFSARHRNTGREVAIKVLHKAESADPTSLRRFVLEARAAAAIDHPGIVQVLDASDGDPAYLVMERLVGETLAERLERERVLPLPGAVTLLAELLDILNAAHRAGFVHRDIKPSNLFVTEEGRLKLLDFGISKVTTSAEALTRTGAVLGTPHFMAPEQLGSARDADHRADLYAAAAVAYRALSGVLPFEEAEDLTTLLLAVQTRAPVSLGARSPGLSPGLSQVIDRALARDPDGRWPSAAAFAEALGLVMRGHEPNHDPLATGPLRAASPEATPTSPGLPRPPEATTPLPPTMPHLAPLSATSVIPAPRIADDTNPTSIRYGVASLGVFAVVLGALVGGVGFFAWNPSEPSSSAAPAPAVPPASPAPEQSASSASSEDPIGEGTEAANPALWEVTIDGRFGDAAEGRARDALRARLGAVEHCFDSDPAALEQAFLIYVSRVGTVLTASPDPPWKATPVTQCAADVLLGARVDTPEGSLTATFRRAELPRE